MPLILGPGPRLGDTSHSLAFSFKVHHNQKQERTQAQDTQAFMHPGSITHTQTLQTDHTPPSTNPALTTPPPRQPPLLPAACRPPAATYQPLARWRHPRPSPPPPARQPSPSPPRRRAHTPPQPPLPAALTRSTAAAAASAGATPHCE
eukprot:scaffold7704_cov112-Isochrysis_galbana.AAC.21